MIKRLVLRCSNTQKNTGQEIYQKNLMVFMVRKNWGKIKQYESVHSLILISKNPSQPFNSIEDKDWKVHNF